MTKPLISVVGLEKTFRLGLTRKKVEAVRGIDFEVEAGDIFGFLGPNGAGKTTTIKMLTALIAPTAGEARLFGRPVADAKAREKVGFLPENPYVYPYLTPEEFVSLSAELAGLRGAQKRERVAASLRKTGIYYAKDRPARRLSKGMLQRTGMAAALVGDPELLILDEPMSGLDPIGRKEMKDLILAERKAGRTIFFSTHILSDVETLCDRVTIMRKGKIVVRGKLSELLTKSAQRVQLVVSHLGSELAEHLRAEATSFEEHGERVHLETPAGDKTQELLRAILSAGASLESCLPVADSLEDIFMREAYISAAETSVSSAPEETR